MAWERALSLAWVGRQPQFGALVGSFFIRQPAAHRSESESAASRVAGNSCGGAKGRENPRSANCHFLDIVRVFNIIWRRGKGTAKRRRLGPIAIDVFGNRLGGRPYPQRGSVAGCWRDTGICSRAELIPALSTVPGIFLGRELNLRLLSIRSLATTDAGL